MNSRWLMRTVAMWGDGTLRREFKYSEDMAAVCVYLMNLLDDRCRAWLGSDKSQYVFLESPLINIDF